MKISKREFEKEITALIEAAKSTSNKETERRFLLQADNKIDGYSNIPSELQQEYRKNSISRAGIGFVSLCDTLQRF